jgi:hypothetical protein
MSETRRTFIAKILAAFTLPAFISKLFAAKPVPVAPPIDEILPSMEILDQKFGTRSFDSGMTQMAWLEQASGRHPESGPAPRIVPCGWRMKRSPSARMMEPYPGWNQDNTI